MISPRHRFLLLLAIPPCLVLVATGLYMIGMALLENEPRDFWSSLEWAAETVTTTGYGRDANWDHPLMVIFVVGLQFIGAFLFYLVVPLYLLPSLEERFEARLPRQVPKLSGHVVIYRNGPAVESLLEELEHADIDTLLVECDETEARRVMNQGHAIVYGPTADEVLPASHLVRARSLVVNGSDEENAAVILLARQLGYEGEILAMIEDPGLAQPMKLAGADEVYEPRELLAEMLSAWASVRIHPRVDGLDHLGRQLEVREIRVESTSPIAGRTLAETELASRTGVTILGQWVKGKLLTRVDALMRIYSRGILIGIGRPENLDKLERTAGAYEAGGDEVGRHGHFVIAGHGQVGTKVSEMLKEAEEEVLTIDLISDEADLQGDILTEETLDEARLNEAQGLILALNTDSTTLFATLVLRNRAPQLPIIARVNEAHNVERIYRAGADFALSFSRVAGQILARRLLGQESVTVDPQLRILKTQASALAGRRVADVDVRQRLECSVVAVERGDEVIVNLDADFRFTAEDTIYVCGSPQATRRFAREMS